MTLLLIHNALASSSTRMNLVSTTGQTRISQPLKTFSSQWRYRCSSRCRRDDGIVRSVFKHDVSPSAALLRWRGGSTGITEQHKQPQPQQHGQTSHHETNSTLSSSFLNTSMTTDVTEDATESSSTTTTSNSTTSTEAVPIPLWKKQFPLLLQRKQTTFHKLTLTSSSMMPSSTMTHPYHYPHQSQTHTVDIYLLGTAHVSNDSCQDVQVLLEAVHPNAIMVELCESRIPLLTLPSNFDPNRTSTGTEANIYAPENKDDFSWWDRVTIIQQAQSCSRLQAISTLLLTSIQEDYAKDLGVELGGEFRTAYQYWKETKKSSATATTPTTIPLVLGDRPMHITLRRAWESLWIWPKIKVLVGLLWSCWQKPNPDEIRLWLQQVLQDESDILTKSFQELQQHFPTLHQVIVQERDAYLAAKLVQLCRCLPSGSQVVAIVGAGHVPGICQWLSMSPSSPTSNTFNVTLQQILLTNPEQILAELVTTKASTRRRNLHQKQKPDGKSQEDDWEWDMLQDCIHQVTALHEMPDESFQWAQSDSQASIPPHQGFPGQHHAPVV